MLTTQDPQITFTLWRHGLVETETAIIDIEDKIDSHDCKKEWSCSCNVWRRLSKAMKEALKDEAWKKEHVIPR
ncbi:MAG: hypothetical protein KGI08_00350 [Thaumarchaeota archaeon]|nr:hypothetical protein [Nitrososphaerota archaeon]